jgi:hypothetical protein
VSLVSVRSFFLLASDRPWSLRPRLFICLQEVGCHKPSRPRVPKDAVDQVARWVAAKEKKKKDAKKARACERTRARDALEKLRRRQERDGLPREPSPETPDDDKDDDEDDNMAARLGLSPGLRLGQESSSQPPSGLAPSVPEVRTPRSRPGERGQTEGVLDPSAGEVEVTPGSQAEVPVSRKPSPTPAAQESDPQVAVAAPGQSVSRAPKVPKVRMVPKPAARRTSTVPSGGRDPRDLPIGTIGHGPERVSTLERLRPGYSFVCPDRDFPFLPSKRSHGLTDLAPRKVLKTASASAAGVAPGLAVQLTFSQDAPQRGAQAAPVAVERVPEAGPSVEVAVALGEAAGADVASGPPDMPPALAPAAAVLVVERPVAADAEMAEASLLGASEEGGVET